MAAKSFFERVYEIVARVPRGKVVSYGQIAWMLDSRRAARQVGYAMRCCPEKLPWHRVVRSDGSIAGGGYEQLRRAMLEQEGILFRPDGSVDIEACRWDGSGAEGSDEQ